MRCVLQVAQPTVEKDELQVHVNANEYFHPLAMKVFFSKDCLLHNPPFEILSGEKVPYFEKPSRLTIIEEELRSNGIDISEELNWDIDLRKCILHVHREEYLEYLETAYDTWIDEGGNKTAVIPEVFPHINLVKTSSENMQIANPLARAGLFCFDLSSPITKDTHSATLASLRVTLTAASVLLLGSVRSAFALCRPPGHHAMPSLCGGYCFLNNIAIAARFIQDSSGSGLTKSLPKIAILDIDYHHGNGSQATFYDDPTVLYVSLHGENDYPYFTGSVSECGSNEGVGFNVNFPLPRGTTGDDEYCSALERAVMTVRKFEPEFLLVSLGVDTHVDDPISDFKVTTPGYLRIGNIISSVQQPTLFVMEGGYALDSIGKNVCNILRGFLSNGFH